MAEPTVQNVAQQVVCLGQQVQALTTQLQVATQEIQQLKSNANSGSGRKSAHCAFSNRKHMLPEKLTSKSDWKILQKPVWIMYQKYDQH